MKKNLGVKIFAALILIIAGFFIYMSFEEFYITGIYKKHNSAYPFGCVNECLWYYKDAKTYSLYNLFCGLGVLMPYLCLLYFLFRFNLKVILIASFLIIIEIMIIMPIIQQIPNS
jgi:hypothetical protein